MVGYSGSLGEAGPVWAQRRRNRSTESGRVWRSQRLGLSPKQSRHSSVHLGHLSRKWVGVSSSAWQWGQRWESARRQRALQPGQGVWERCYARASELRARAFINVRSQCGGQAKTDPSDRDEARADPNDRVPKPARTSATELKLARTPATELKPARTPATVLQLAQTPATELKLAQTPATELKLARTPATEMKLARTPATVLQLARTPVT